MGDCNTSAPSSPLKACLIAPTFSPTRKEKGASSWRAATNCRLLASAANTIPNDGKVSAHSSVDDAVRKAYKKVKRERDSKRQELVKSVLRESRDKVIHECLGKEKNRMHEICDCAPDNIKNEKQQNVDAVKRAATSSPSCRNKRSRNDPMIDVAEEKKNDSDMCSYDDHGKEGRRSSNGNVSPPQQTLVFPRLPSNVCPSYQVFAPPLCRTASDEEDNADNDKEKLKTAVPPNLSNESDPEYSLTIKWRGGNGSQTSTTAHVPLLIEGAHPPRPKSSSLIFLESALAVDDEPSLSHVPYFEDGDNEDIYSDLFDTTERERLYEFGPKYREDETLETVDEVLKLMAEKRMQPFEDEDLFAEATVEGATAGTGGGGTMKRSKMAQELERIHSVLSELANVDVERVHERHLRCFFSEKQESDGPNASSKEADESSNYNNSSDNNKTSNKTATDGPQKNSDTTAKIPYESIMDSYCDLFCRRCFTYDCNIHGNLPKANLDLLGELAVQKQVDGHWKELDNDISPLSISNNCKEKDSNDEICSPEARALTPAQKSICNRAHVIFQGDIEKIARAIGTVPATVDAFVKSEKMELRPNKVTSQPSYKKNGNRAYCSMKNYNQKWLRHIQSKVILPAFLPCDHEGPCNDSNCSCVANGFFCHKACGWGSKSPNFFRGCECKAGQCQKNSCPCYAAKRECDPDLCRTCGACTDPPGKPARKGGQRCRNDAISMRRHCHLLIAESSIKQAGWGLFTKHSLKKGDFVHEYVGEIISQEEAERRGVIYDKLNMSYLFNLSSDLVVDSTRKGNKARYANHSSTPNIEPRMIHVNGDMRIGFYAKHDIDAQSELFFDYRYDDKMDNELIYKPDHSVNFAWMK